MSKRARVSHNNYSDPFFDDDCSSDEDYVPSESDDDNSDANNNGKINPYDWSREQLQVPSHLTNIISARDLNSMQFEILTKNVDDEEEDDSRWKTAKSILLTQTVVKSDGEEDGEDGERLRL